MKRFLFYVLATWVILLACFGCRTARPVAIDPPETAYPSADTARTRLGHVVQVRADSLVVQPYRTLLAKVLRRPAPAKTYQAATIRAGKKATITIYAAPATITTAARNATIATGGAVAAGKQARGPLIRADSGATVQVATSAKGPASAAGHDASATQTKPGGTTTWQAWLLRAGLAALAGFVCVALWFGLPLLWPWLLALFRRGKNDTTA